MTTTTIAPDPIDSARTLARRVLAALLALLSKL
jgi:hypothetical protein